MIRIVFVKDDKIEVVAETSTQRKAAKLLDTDITNGAKYTKGCRIGIVKGEGDTAPLVELYEEVFKPCTVTEG